MSSTNGAVNLGLGTEEPPDDVPGVDWSKFAPSRPTAGDIDPTDDAPDLTNLFGDDEEPEQVPGFASTPEEQRTREVVNTPLWDQWTQMRDRGNYLLLVQRLTPEGRKLDLGELPASASRTEILAAVREPGTYHVLPIHESGAPARNQPYVISFDPDHFYFRQQQAKTAVHQFGDRPPAMLGGGMGGVDAKSFFAYLGERDQRVDDRRQAVDMASVELIGKQLDGAKDLYTGVIQSETDRTAAVLAAERERNEQADRLRREAIEEERRRAREEIDMRGRLADQAVLQQTSFADRMIAIENARIAAREREIEREAKREEERRREERIERDRRDREEQLRRDAERDRERAFYAQMAQMNNPMNAVQAVVGMVAGIVPVLGAIGINGETIGNAVKAIAGGPAEEKEDNIYSVLKSTVETIGKVAGPLLEGALAGDEDDDDDLDEEGEEEEAEVEEEEPEPPRRLTKKERLALEAQAQAANPAPRALPAPVDVPDPMAGAYRPVAAVHELAHLQKPSKGTKASEDDADTDKAVNDSGLNGPARRAATALLTDLRGKPAEEWIGVITAKVTASKPLQAAFKAHGITATAKAVGATDDEVATILAQIDTLPPMFKAKLDGIKR